MKNFTRPLLPVAFALCATSLWAQVEFGGDPVGLMRSDLGAAPVVQMSAVDVDALMAEDAASAASGIKGPFRFGFNHTVDLGTDNSGAWSTLPNGDRVWRLAIRCPEAKGINFIFGQYVVPSGAHVFVYNEQGDRSGGFTAESNPGHAVLGVSPMSGDVITVEYDEPAAMAGQGHLRITQVTHEYRDILGSTKGLNDSGACNNNVICSVGDPWRDQIKAVAMIVVGGSGYCTGQLINNCANDGTPYFLTANHCTQGSNPATWTFRFKWESPTCTPTANAPTNKTVSGSTLLVNSGGSDVALLQLNSTPPASYGVYYGGWDKSGTAPTASTVIHHPAGDIKKISFDNDAAVTGTFDGAQCWHILNWDDGTTEGGSSGSALWNQDHHIIGQLFGGQAQCNDNVNDYFGRFNISFPLLTQWLGECGNTLDGFDPNGPNGIQDNGFAQAGITVQPNPSTGRFTFTLNGKAQATALVVRDAMGREVQRNVLNNTSTSIDLDLRNLPEACYFVEITGPGLRAVQRVVVSR